MAARSSVAITDRLLLAGGNRDLLHGLLPLALEGDLDRQDSAGVLGSFF
jgi:hypothetical protein